MFFVKLYQLLIIISNLHQEMYFLHIFGQKESINFLIASYLLSCNTV